MRNTLSLVLSALLGLTSILHAQSTKTDAVGDPLPPGALARLGTLRWRAGSTIIFVAYRTDGKSLVTVGQDFVVQIWDTATGKEIKKFDASGGTAAINALGGRVSPFAHSGAVALSGDGKTLVCGSRDGIVRI